MINKKECIYCKVDCKVVCLHCKPPEDALYKAIKYTLSPEGRKKIEEHVAKFKPSSVSSERFIAEIVMEHGQDNPDCLQTDISLLLLQQNKELVGKFKEIIEKNMRMKGLPGENITWDTALQFSIKALDDVIKLISEQ